MCEHRSGADLVVVTLLVELGQRLRVGVGHVGVVVGVEEALGCGARLLRELREVERTVGDPVDRLQGRRLDGGDGLGRQHAVAVVAGHHQHVGATGLDLGDLGRQVGDVGGVVGERRADLDAGLLRLGLEGVTYGAAERTLLVQHRHRLDRLVGRLGHLVEELRAGGAEHCGAGLHPERVLVALGENRVRAGHVDHQRHLVAFGHRGHVRGDRALVGADQADHAVLNEALCLALADLRLALGVSAHQFQLLAALRLDATGVVDRLDGQLGSVVHLLPVSRGRSAQRVQGTDLYGAAGLGAAAVGRAGGPGPAARGEGQRQGQGEAQGPGLPHVSSWGDRVPPHGTSHGA